MPTPQSYARPSPAFRMGQADYLHLVPHRPDVFHHPELQHDYNRGFIFEKQQVPS